MFCFPIDTRIGSFQPRHTQDDGVDAERCDEE
jgi:hypothetical protein